MGTRTLDLRYAPLCYLSPEEKFWVQVDTSGGPDACWPWLGVMNRGNYGDYRIGTHSSPAHRKALELTDGLPTDEWQVVCHSCDNPPCCNPKHLRRGSKSENSREAYERGRRLPVVLRGEDNGKFKWSDDEVNRVKEARSRGISYSKLSKMFGIPSSTIHALCTEIYRSPKTQSQYPPSARRR